jgi:hypothetical protein
MPPRLVRQAIIGTIVALSLASAAMVGVAAQKKRRPLGTGAERPIAGGRFEASGVVHVGGTDGVLFVDDGRNDAVFWMRIDREGKQLESAAAVPLGVSVGDPEGITTDGTWYYVVGSQSKREFVKGAGLVRFRFDPASRRASNAEAVEGLRERLLAQLPSVAAASGTAADGLNIEGLAADRGRNRLLLGLRSPLLNGQSIIVPVDLSRLGDRWATDRLAVAEPDLIRLPLGQAGIRSMEFDGSRNGFWIIAAADRGNAPFRLWDWDGSPSPSARLTPDATFDARLKPEGVTAMAGQLDFRLIVFDTSRFITVQER